MPADSCVYLVLTNAGTCSKQLLHETECACIMTGLWAGRAGDCYSHCRRTKRFSVHVRAQRGPAAHVTCYSMRASCFFRGGEAARTLRCLHFHLVLRSRIWQAAFIARLPCSWQKNHVSLLCCCGQAWDRVSSLLRFLDHTQRRATIDRTDLDEWSARCRDHFPKRRNTHNRQKSVPLAG
jgi:hypothetical protein